MDVLVVFVCKMLLIYCCCGCLFLEFFGYEDVVWIFDVCGEWCVDYEFEI